MIVWRLTRRPYADLTGTGGIKVEGRWHTAGKPIIYLVEHPALALLEVRVHLDLPFSLLPVDYVLMKVGIPDDLPQRELETETVDTTDTQRVGDNWLVGQSESVARVKSFVSPFSYNYLLNPLHDDASRVIVLGTIPIQFDPRLW